MSEFRGVFAIPPTPFTKRGDLDEPSLRRVLRFCVEAGVHGIVTPVNASEFAFLTDAERGRVVETAVSEAGSVPVVAGVAGSCAEHAVILARQAREAGAAAVIAMPPYVRQASPAEIREYYRALALAAGIPLFIQNHLPPQGTQMRPEFVSELVRDIPLVSYVKEECYPPGQFMSMELALGGPALLGVMGGIAGRYLMDEYARGACGTMPACEIADVHVQLWERLEVGDAEGARRIFDAMLPLLNLENMHGVSLYKYVLHRRGLIDSPRVRQPGLHPLDEHDRAEVDVVLERLKPLFRISEPVAGGTGRVAS